MLIGQLAFWAGVFGLVCQLAALGLSTWQKAPGGVTMGLWQECQAGGCSDISSDGMSVRQYNTLWVTRVILCLSVCICFGALFCASKVVSDTGTRRHVKVGKWLFFAAATTDLLDMSLYMDQLKLPNKGQEWGVAMGLVILAWVLWYPLAFVFMRIAMGARRYEPPKKPTIPIMAVDTKDSPGISRMMQSWKPPRRQKAKVVPSPPAGESVAVMSPQAVQVVVTSPLPARTAAEDYEAFLTDISRLPVYSGSGKVSESTVVQVEEHHRSAWIDDDRRAVRGVQAAADT